MADGEQDREQKTEAPTTKRLEEARKRGQVPFSREVGSFLILGVFTLTIAWYLPVMFRNAGMLLTPLLANTNDYAVDRGGLGILLTHLLRQTLLLLVVPLAAAVTVTLAASILQNGIIISIEPIIPRWEKVSLRRGLERLFSQRSVIEFLKGLFKMIIVGVVAFFAVKGDLGHMRQLEDHSVAALVMFMSRLAIKLMVGVCVAMFFIALFDLIYQRLDYVKNLRMSRQELKDEFRQQEGDPMIKRRLRQIRMERARKRMIAEVPKADVVITNPTHYAVALQYENASMQAPKVIAKGIDFMALNMRRIAEEHEVPVVENPPLARTLYDNVEVDQEIPVQHYQAVAEIISYVWRLKGKLPKLPQAQRRKAP